MRNYFIPPMPVSFSILKTMINKKFCLLFTGNCHIITSTQSFKAAQAPVELPTKQVSTSIQTPLYLDGLCQGVETSFSLERKQNQ